VIIAVGEMTLSFSNEAGKPGGQREFTSEAVPYRVEIGVEKREGVP
jgi:hypothetical protein